MIFMVCMKNTGNSRSLSVYDIYGFFVHVSVIFSTHVVTAVTSINIVMVVILEYIYPS